MVGEGVVDVLAGIGQVALWLQAIGIVVVLWIIFQVTSWVYNRKRMREVMNIKEDMKRIETKIDRLLGKS